MFETKTVIVKHEYRCRKSKFKSKLNRYFKFKIETIMCLTIKSKLINNSYLRADAVFIAGNNRSKTGRKTTTTTTIRFYILILYLRAFTFNQMVNICH